MIIPPETLDPERTYRLLTGVVVPRPIAWICTLNETGRVNLAPFSCFTFVSNKPPMVGINVGRKGDVLKDTGRNIHARGEFVVNIADETMIEAVHASAVEYPPEVGEAELLGLETAPSMRIRTLRLAAAPVSLECRFYRAISFGDTGSEFIVGEVVLFHVRDGLYEKGKIDSTLLRPICRLGGPNYGKLGEVVRMAPVAQTPKRVLNR